MIDHLFEYGLINTEELQERYGYTHPPRAIRDVREAGIPIESHRIVSSRTGRAWLSTVSATLTMESTVPASLKDSLIDEHGEVDNLTGQAVPARMLQIDHRVPYEIAGKPTFPLDTPDFMLLDASTQRAKAFTCAE